MTPDDVRDWIEEQFEDFTVTGIAVILETQALEEGARDFNHGLQASLASMRDDIAPLWRHIGMLRATIVDWESAFVQTDWSTDITDEDDDDSYGGGVDLDD